MSRKGDNDRRSYDSGGGHYGGQMFKVAVVGLSGTEKDKGCLGVGKSCLCNRFVRPQADQYNPDHISVLSQSDFSGPIVNNEHWLYWGETRKCTEEGFELTFSVVEQTEFVDDACFLPFRSGKMEPYYKRCSSTRLSSAEKLMYICKNQLGVEKEYEQHYLSDGRFQVDGFVCVFDTSKIEGRPIERQVDFTAMILSSLLKAKKPVVLVTTKNDEACEQYVREAEKLVGRREFKGLIPLVETSAHDSVNVDLAFWACVQRDWTKGKTKIISYNEASQRQSDRLGRVNDAYLTLIRSQVTDYRTHWTNSYSNFSQSNDFQKYCDLFGQESAQKTFKHHVKILKDDYVCRKMQMYLRILPEIFNQLLPDLDSFGPDKSWLAVKQIIRNHPLFENHFIENESVTWQDMDDNLNGPISFDLLTTAEAEKVFVDHRDSLLAEEHLRSLRHQFSELLRETSIAPGQPLKEIRDLLASRECVKTLPETELSIIYEDYQRMLQERAREQLIELFLERPSLFLQYCSGDVVTQDDLVAISSKMEDDERWTALDLLPQDRSLDLFRHLGFVQWPIKEHCPSYNACVDINTEAYCSTLAKRSPRHPLWNSEPEVIRIKLVVLGSSSLAENLATVVKAMRPTLEQENSRIYLDVRVSNSNEGIGILGSRLYPNPLEPEAYLCVYSSRGSLEYVRKSLEQSLLTDLQFGNPHHASPPSIGLPLVLLLASNADTSAKERVFLREEGQNRAQSLQCAFFDVTSDETHARFKPDELLRALMFLIDSLIRRSDLLHVYSPATSALNSLIPEGALNPEIRILVCMMCGDPISPAHFLELLLLPNSLPNTTFYPVSKHSIVTDVGCLAALDEENENVDLDLSQVPSRYVEFVLTSYHGSYAYREELLHGYILVYWSKRQASFCNMSALASTIGPIMPIQILTLVENESRPSKLSHQLVAEGQGLAQSLNAHFRVSTLSPDLGRCISSFLNYSLQNKLHIEKGLQMSPSAHSQIDRQSPGSGLTNPNDECYDPNSDQHFGSLIPPHQPLHHHHRQLSNDHDQAANLSDGIYEHLPDDERQHQQQQAQQQQQQAQSQFTSNLVRQPRVERKPLHSFSSNILDAEEPETVEDARHYFNQHHSPYETENNGSGEEHLVKPSQIKQRKHLNSEDKRNVNADKCAVNSGWAYVQPNQPQINELNAMRVQLPDQWPPTQPTDDESSLNERFKAPGKIDIKRYNNLSNAIGRLNLNSPLGPTRANANSSFDSTNMAENYNAEQLGMLANTLGQTNRRGRLRNKQLSSKVKSDKQTDQSTGELDSPITRKSTKQSKKSKEDAGKKKNGIQKTLESFAQPNGNPVPLFVVKCTQFIEKHLDTEGLYRIPGNKTTIDPFIQKFEENSEIDFDQLDEPVCTVATALKEFFMKRMPSIFPIHCLDEMIRVQKQYTDTRQLDGIKAFLRKLPNANYEIISFMFHHFTKISSHSEKNNMNSSNLAICWWPTLMQFDFPDYNTFEENRHYLIDLAKLLIDAYSQIFSPNNNISNNDNNKSNNTLRDSNSTDLLTTSSH